MYLSKVSAHRTIYGLPMCARHQVPSQIVSCLSQTLTPLPADLLLAISVMSALASLFNWLENPDLNLLALFLEIVGIVFSSVAFKLMRCRCRGGVSFGGLPQGSCV